MDYVIVECSLTPKTISSGFSLKNLKVSVSSTVSNLCTCPTCLGTNISVVQGSHFDERLLLSRKPERTLVRQMLTEEIQTDDFVDSDILQSDNGRLLVPLVNRLQENWPDEFPEVYKRYYIRIIVVF